MIYGISVNTIILNIRETIKTEVGSLKSSTGIK